MIPAVTFTYAGDATLIPAWCEIHRSVGLDPVVVEDAAAPLPAWVVRWLASYHVELRRSHFPRRGNLRGTDCAAGIAATLAAVCRTRGAASAIKIDTDTAVVRPDLFAAVTHGPAAIAGLLDPAAGRHDAFGMAYAITAAASSAIADHLATLPSQDPYAPEDTTIWRAAKALGLMCWPLRFNRRTGPFTVVPEWADHAEAAARFSVLTWGNPLPGRGRSTAHILTGLRLTQKALQEPLRQPLRQPLRAPSATLPPTPRHHPANPPPQEPA